MTQNQQQELGKTLWGIANNLRGAMMADDFRDYMLSFLFWKYLSDSYVNAAKKVLGPDYPETPKDVLDTLGVSTPLQIWYNENPNDVLLFERQMKRKTHYIIEPQYLWDNIVELARTQSAELLLTLEAGFKYIENDSFDSSFKGLFSEINLSSEKLGKNYTERNELLTKVITTIANGLKEFSADCQDPASGKKNRINRVLDFACGSGSLLLNVRNQMGESGIGKIYGQEKNITTYNLCRMNMLLHGVKDSAFEIHHGDSLANDWDILQEENPANKIDFDAVVANPPFSLRWDPTEDTANDFRFNRYGVAPRSAADFAFLLHGLHFLSEDGTMAIILPHGVLFRGGKELAIRKKLLEDDNIDAVIGLPGNLFYSTGIPVCIIVLKKCRKNDKILFINASSDEHYEKGKRQNYLRDEDVNKIVDTYQFRKEESRYSRQVSLQEIKDNDYNLNITRYVSLAQEEKPIDLQEVHDKLVEIEAEIVKARDKHNEFLKELGLPPLV